MFRFKCLICSSFGSFTTKSDNLSISVGVSGALYVIERFSVEVGVAGAGATESLRTGVSCVFPYLLRRLHFRL